MIRVWKVIIYRIRRFSHERSEWEKSNAVKIPLRTSVIQYFIPREPNNHIKVMILRLERYNSIYYNGRIFIILASTSFGGPEVWYISCPQAGKWIFCPPAGKRQLPGRCAKRSCRFPAPSSRKIVYRPWPIKKKASDHMFVNLGFASADNYMWSETFLILLAMSRNILFFPNTE